MQSVLDYLAKTVSLGSIDGVLEKNVCSVDGYPLEESEAVYEALQQVVTACTVPSGIRE